jgi:hypothetical protein
VHHDLAALAASAGAAPVPPAAAAVPGGLRVGGGSVYAFDQTPFVPGGYSSGSGLSTTGYAYVSTP